MKKMNTLFSILALSVSASAFAGGANDHDHMHSGKDSSGGPVGMAHWMSPAAEQKRPNLVEASQASIKKGAQLFQKNCVSCHGANAEGDGPAGMALIPKPTNLRAMSGGHPDGDFAWKIKNGRGPMPAWGSILDDRKIWHLVNYIQSLGKTGAGYKPIKHDHAGHKH